MITTEEVTKDEVRQLAIRDRHHEALDLMQRMSFEVIQSDEDLSFWHALCLTSTVRYTEGKEATDDFIRRFASPENPGAVGRGRLLQSHIHIMDGDTESSYNLELEAVSILPESAYHERLRSWSTIDTMAGHMGETPKIEQAAETLANIRHRLPLDQSWWYSFVVPNRADILAKRGLLAESEQLLLTHLSTVPGEEAAVLKLRLAVLALEHQNPTKAREWLEDVAHDGPEAYWRTEAFLVATRIHRQLGDSERAMAILTEGMAEKERSHARAELLQAQMQLGELWIQQGNIDLAESWVTLAAKSLDPWPRTFGHPIPDMIRSELEIAKGNLQTAIKLLEALRNEGERRKHTGLLVGIYAHLAYAHALGGDTQTATVFSTQAINAGGGGNFAKSFTVLGLDVRRFLTGSPENLVANSAGHATGNRRALLSDRELEILALVEAGKRNYEIADSLYLSVSTVKNHLANIFKKLGVNNRKDALYNAVQMGILQENQSNRE